MDETQQTSASVVRVATVGNVISPLSAYLAMNARPGDDHNQVARAQQNITHRYNTKWEWPQVQELSAEEEELKRLQASINARKAALMAGGDGPSTSTVNPNLSVQQQMAFESYAQFFAPTLVFTALKPWSIPEYTAPLQMPLYKVLYGQLT